MCVGGCCVRVGIGEGGDEGVEWRDLALLLQFSKMDTLQSIMYIFY